MKNKKVALSAISEFSSENKRLKLEHIFVVMLYISVTALSVSAAPSFLDINFGSGGKVISSPDGSQLTVGTSMALQTDGKIIMGGSGNSLGFIVARYNPNGSLDTTFGENGWKSVIFTEGSGSVSSIAIQPDGKIVIGGNVTFQMNNFSFNDFGIARLNADGSLDTTFDNDGKTTLSFSPEVVGSFARETLSSVKIAGDGKIVLGGQATDPAVSSRFILGRLNANGSLDTTFGTNGRIVGNSGYNFLNDLTTLPDGSVIAVGSSSTIGIRLAIKYDVNGGILWTYSVFDGEFTQSGLNGIAVQPDGKLIVVGQRNSKVVAARLNTDGTEDNSFSSITSTPSGKALSVAIQTDGKIVANFFPLNGWGDTRNSFNLIRFNANGSLDSSFGSGGTINSTVTDGLDYGRKVLIQPDGKILVGGYSVLSSPTRYYFSMMRFQGDAAIPNRPLFDYDGDGKSDVSVFRPSTGIWYLNQSTNGFAAVQFGISTDRIVPADYDGDGKTDIAVYRDGIWWILQSGNNSVIAFQFGVAEDKPQSGDFDGDGKDDLAVFRPSTGVWFVLRSSDGGFSATQFGLSSDIPQSADYDGDGRTDLAVFRPSNGTWYIQRSLGGYLFPQFGANGDLPIANDFDGDGRTDIAVLRPSTRQWFILRSSDNQFEITTFGMQSDISVPADYDGDGKADIAVFRPSNGGWYQRLSTQGSASQIFGLNNDLPTPNAFNP